MSALRFLDGGVDHGEVVRHKRSGVSLPNASQHIDERRMIVYGFDDEGGIGRFHFLRAVSGRANGDFMLRRLPSNARGLD